MSDPEFDRKLAKAKREALKLGPVLPGQLVVPGVGLPAKDPRDMIKTYLTWQEVYPSSPPPTLDELLGMVRQFNCSDILQSLAKLNIVFSRVYRGGAKLPVELFKSLFEADAFQRIVDAKTSRDAVIPYRPAIIFLEKLALLHALAEGGETVATKPLDFGKLIIGATEHAEGPHFADARLESAADAEKKEILAGTFFRNLIFNGMEDFSNQVARYWAMLTLYPPGIKEQLPDEFFDLDTFFLTETGMEPELYLMFAFSIFGHYIRPGPADVLTDAANFPIGATYLKNIRPELHEKAARFMGIFTRDRPTFRDALAMERPIANAGGYDARFIFESPLYKAETGVHFPLDLDLLGDQATKGLYWKAFDLLRISRRDQYLRFKTWWGRLFEWHIRSVLESYLPGKSKLDKRLYVEGEDGFNGADFVIHDGDGIVVIEATTSGVPLTKIVDGAGKDIFSSLEKFLFETEHGDKGKVVQLADFIEGFKTGRNRVGDIDPAAIRTICPVIISEQGFPQIHPFVGFIRDDASKRTSLGKLAERLEFWDCEELELMGAVIKSGASAAILDKHSSGWGSFPMKNYLNWKNAASDSGLMRDLFHSFADKVRDSFFKK